MPGLDVREEITVKCALWVTVCVCVVFVCMPTCLFCVAAELMKAIATAAAQHLGLLCGGDTMAAQTAREK